jgi:hypothetical protein
LKDLNQRLATRSVLPANALQGNGNSKSLNEWGKTLLLWIILLPASFDGHMNEEGLELADSNKPLAAFGTAKRTDLSWLQPV